MIPNTRHDHRVALGKPDHFGPVSLARTIYNHAFHSRGCAFGNQFVTNCVESLVLEVVVSIIQMHRARNNSTRDPIASTSSAPRWYKKISLYEYVVISRRA